MNECILNGDSGGRPQCGRVDGFRLDRGQAAVARREEPRVPQHGRHHPASHVGQRAAAHGVQQVAPQLAVVRLFIDFILLPTFPILKTAPGYYFLIIRTFYL